MAGLSNLQAATRALRLGELSFVRSEKTHAQLASGKRINRASDDAAGSSISARLEAKIRGSQQAGRNIQDAVSLLQTAGGTLDQAQQLVQRLRELAVMAANDTMTDQDRLSLQAESNQLRHNLNDLAGHTEFNGHPIFSEATTPYAINQSWTPGTVDTISFPGSALAPPPFVDIAVSNAALGDQAWASGTMAVASSSAGALTAGDPNGFTYANGAVRLWGSAVPSGLGMTTLTIGMVSAADNVFRVPGNATSGSSSTTSNYIASAASYLFDEASFVLSVNGTPAAYTLTRSYATAAGPGGPVRYEELTLNPGLLGLAPDGGGNLVTLTGTGSKLGSGMRGTIQLGGEAGKTFDLVVPDMGLDSLGLNDFNVSTQVGAAGAINQIDRALETLSTAQGSVGAQINALTQHLDVVSGSELETQASLSQIQDADVARGAILQARDQILQQSVFATVSMARNLEHQRVQALLTLPPTP